MIKFIDFINIRYEKAFNYWDDYALYLFYDICKMNEDRYYELLEKDIKMYSDIQTGEEREVEKDEL